jgi:tripartite-type tricarboxylate transporter receptor subunit TctC
MLARRTFLLAVSSAACGVFDLEKVWAQTYPSRPITMVVPVAAGSGMDTVARIVAERLRISLGQPMIVENVSGASGSIGIGRVARASPDGYTLSYGAWATHVVNGAVYALPYDLRSDFEPIAQTINTRFVIAARNSLPVSDLKGLVAWLKANPEKVSAATSGAGSPAHIGGILLQNLTGARFQFVPYRGSAQAMQDLVAGQVDLMIDNTVNALPLHRAGRIKVLAALAETRLAAAAAIPSADEAGVPGFHLDSWHAMWAPKGTPQAVVAKLGAAVAEALADPAVQKRIADLGAEIAPRERQTPSGFGTFHKIEVAKWWPIIKAAGIKAQ